MSLVDDEPKLLTKTSNRATIMPSSASTPMVSERAATSTSSASARIASPTASPPAAMISALKSQAQRAEDRPAEAL